MFKLNFTSSMYTNVLKAKHMIIDVRFLYCICGAMVRMLALSVVDRGFEPRSGQT